MYSTLTRFLNFVKKDLTNIRSVDIYHYFQYIDKRMKFKSKNAKNKYLSYSTKKQIRTDINRFFKKYQIYLLSKNIDYNNPVPPFDFKVRNRDIINPLNEKKENIFNDNELKEILIKSKEKSMRDFIIFLLLICCGMRKNECLTIEKKNINLETRILTTGYVKGARKSTKRTKKALIFFFPKEIVPYLEFYINTNNSQKWLFKGHNRNNHVINVRKGFVERYGIKASQFHNFRRTLITRFDENPNMLPHIREVLMNHTPSTTQGQSYIKKSIKIKKNDYDRFFPYYHILKEI